MTQPRLVHAEAVADDQLFGFFRKSFGESKARFLQRHGEWWHRDKRNQFLVVDRSEILAYSALIPSRILVGRTAREAVWLVDVMVDPHHRGRGLQTILDQAICSRPEIKLGFPNLPAARIHRRHGWGVREDLRWHRLVLRPRDLVAARRSQGHSTAWAAAALLLTPLALLLSCVLRHTSAGRTRVSKTRDFERLAGIFEAHEGQRATTLRDRDQIAWRYSSAPYADQLRSYIGETDSRGRVALVARTVNGARPRQVRILDLFGDLRDQRLVAEVLRSCARDAVAQGAIQVTALSSSKEVRRCLRRSGFFLETKARFCWHTSDPTVSKDLGSTCHWVLGDSDNDEPGDDSV